MTTCKSFRIFYEPEDARWSSSENLFILINRYNFLEKMKLLLLLFILKLYTQINIFECHHNFIKFNIKTRKCLDQHLIDEHKIYLVQKYVIPQPFVDIDSLLNCIRLKLLQQLQDLVHFLHFLFCLLFFFALPKNYYFRRL